MFYKNIDKLRIFSKIILEQLRCKLFKLRGLKSGKKTRIGKNVTIDKPWLVSLGQRTFIEDNVYIKITSDNARIIIGDYVYIGNGSQLDIIGDLEIGEHTLIAPNCFITDHNHGISSSKNIDQQPCIYKKVTIGNDVWLGTKSVVLPGVKISDKAVTGSGSIITKSVATLEIAAGVPAQKIGSRNNNHI